MTDFVANRRLYRGAGEYVEKGEPVGSISAADAKRLKERGAIIEKKKAPKPENKMEPKPENKSKAKG